ncbi:hypothetical protein HK097_006680, partial [Rhizophlyctis rosea]
REDDYRFESRGHGGDPEWEFRHPSQQRNPNLYGVEPVPIGGPTPPLTPRQQHHQQQRSHTPTQQDPYRTPSRLDRDDLDVGYGHRRTPTYKDPRPYSPDRDPFQNMNTAPPHRYANHRRSMTEEYTSRRAPSRQQAVDDPLAGSRIRGDQFGESGPGYSTPTVPTEIPQNRRREAWEVDDDVVAPPPTRGGFDPRFDDPRSSPPIQRSMHNAPYHPLDRVDSPMRMNSSASVVLHQRQRSEVDPYHDRDEPPRREAHRRSHSRAQSVGGGANFSIPHGIQPTIDAEFANAFFSGYLQKQNRHRRYQKRLFRLDGLLLLCLSPSVTRKTPDNAPLVRVDPNKFRD